ncbi:hypothetical protein [Fodinibius sp. AD559]|uniref:hypothetical protein n=1 Tax=Fodinibius sp. AD559 TaxID=3424179 RepID=UPI004046BEF4
MFNNSIHNGSGFLAYLIVVGSLFCIVFGQGLHIHSISLHFEDHVDVHAHVHAHESTEEDSEGSGGTDGHQHEVSTSDIIGTLTTSTPIEIDVQAATYIFVAPVIHTIENNIGATPTLFDLPPPRPVANQYHLFSFSLRGPPIA